MKQIQSFRSCIYNVNLIIIRTLTCCPLPIWWRSEKTPLLVTCDWPICTIQWKWRLRDYESVTKLLCMLETIRMVGQGHSCIYNITIYTQLENYNNFWLVKTLVIKKTCSWVLLGHITGCNLPFNQSNVTIIFKTGIIWHQSSWRYAPKSNVVNFGYILNTGADSDFFQWGVSRIFFGGKWWRKVD